jgi:hypothetical protein
MKWVLFGIGLLWIMGGTVLLFNTEIVRKNFFQKMRQINPKKLSPCPMIFGLLLALSATASSHKIVIYVLAGMGLAKGIFFLAMPEVKARKWTDWSLSFSDKTYMGLGVLLAILGSYVLGTMIVETPAIVTA